MSPFELEALFAAIGLVPILDGKPRMSDAKSRAVAELPTELRKRLVRFLASDKVKPAVEVPQFDYQRVLETVTDTVTGKDVAADKRALFELLGDDDLADALHEMAERIATWADKIMPRDARTVVGGAVLQGEPDVHTVADFRRQWQVAADPWIVLGDLEDGSLSDDQVQAMMLHFPALYAEVRQAAKDALAMTTARRGKDWEPDPIKAGLLSTLLQEPDIDLELAQIVQSVYANDPEAAMGTKPRASHRKPPPPPLTPGQKAEASMSASGT